MSPLLRGLERVTLELAASLDPGVAERLVGPSLHLDFDDNGAAKLGLIAFEMHALRLGRLPWPTLGYSEGLWRIAVRWGGMPAWFAVVCDIDRALARALGSRLVRYPVRPAQIAIAEQESETTLEIRAQGGVLRARIVPDGVQAPHAGRPLLVRSRGALWRIPWIEEPAPLRYAASIVVDEDGLSEPTFGALVWQRRGVLHRGRVHRCGFAEPVDFAAAG